ncbi:MAG TPA: cytochrome b N-terminal domain-containing protein [Acidimicrobiales bacterium]|nr:cytochrome b N-terminal domain-containing protein [Acidimicrobiales bacterium]
MRSVIISSVNLNGPGGYLHWSIFTVSVANLVLIAVMVAIFGAALLIRFPGHPGAEEGSAVEGTESDGAGAREGAAHSEQAGYGAPGTGDAPGVVPGDRTWTGAIRRAGLRLLPPGKLLPDRQPAYVASWIYVFGVAALASLGLAIVSGFAIALGGSDWWHTNPVGHFFNSLHLWSVELFMALMVIHLWGKFWMAAWRGKRALTWISGGLAFMASVVECFTGYLSQQNFDSQWISTNGKDAINATGLGGFFNLMNFGQMLMWHIVLIPIVLIALVGAHVLLVRVRGVSHPLPARRARTKQERAAQRVADAADWKGPTRVYDIVKEATIATGIALVLVVLLASVLSSPDEPTVTIASWAKIAPADFLATAGSELNGTSETAGYGPPYNNGNRSTQSLVVSWERLAGVRIPVNAAATFVLGPLSKVAPTDPPLQAALNDYVHAGTKQQMSWVGAYLNALAKVHFVSGTPVMPKAADGPVPQLLGTELTLARSGALDADLIAEQQFYGTNFTKPLLFLEDGQYFAQKAKAQHLTGAQWGVMNETGSYPGQPWLWLYTLWYQLPGFDHSANVDLIAIYMTGAATVLLLAVPFIPGLRDIPEIVPLHRLVWRRWNSGRYVAGVVREDGAAGEGQQGATEAASPARKERASNLRE